MKNNLFFLLIAALFVQQAHAFDPVACPTGWATNPKLTQAQKDECQKSWDNAWWNN